MDKENRLLQWIRREKKRKGWSYRFMANRVDYSHTGIADILNSKEPITLKFCIEMAKLFNRHPAEFIVMSELLPDDKIHDAILILSRLPQNDLNESLNFLQYLHSKSN